MDRMLVQEKLEEHDKRLEKHGDKIDTLEKNDAISKTRIDSLCKSLDDLTATLKWLSGFLLSSTSLLIIYSIEQLMSK